MDKGQPFNNKALSMPSGDSAWRSRVTSWMQHKLNCVTATVTKTETRPAPVQPEDANTLVLDTKIITVVTDGCSIGRLCSKGQRLLIEIDNPPKHVHGKVGIPGSRLVRKCCRMSAQAIQKLRVRA